MKTGIDVLISNKNLQNSLRHLRLAVLAHAASIDAQGRHTLVVLRELGLNVAKIFAPEHGLWGAAQDMEGTDDVFDAVIKRDVTSLYGHDLDSLRPKEGALDGIDAVIIDLQDIGVRYYTYVYSALMLAESALALGLRVLVLDRPNPIGGMVLEGNIVCDGYDSFVGMRKMMTRHGMTIGEMLPMWCAEDKTKNRELLEVIAMQGYDRQKYFDELGLTWVLPSPNMPTLDTAIVYAGMCLLEGTNLSEGRGTTRPFEIFGAPWIDTEATQQALELLNLPGCFFRPLEFKPQFQKQAGLLCRGFQLHVTDRHSFNPLLTGIAIISVISALCPEFAWRSEAYEFVTDRLAIDLLLGDPNVRLAIQAQENPHAIADDLNAASAKWREHRAAHLRY